MSSSGLLVCSFYVQTKFDRNKEHYLDLNNEIGNLLLKGNFLDLLNKFCLQYKNVERNDKIKKTFSIDKNTLVRSENDDYTCLSFTVCCGQYGIKSEIIDADTFKPRFEKEITDSDVKRFKVLFFVPKQKGGKTIQKGIAIFQSIGNYGVKSITSYYLKRFFSENKITFNTRNIISTGFIKKLLEENKIKKVTVVKNQLSKDDSDNMFDCGGVETRSVAYPILKPNFIDWLKFHSFNKNENGLYEYEDEEFSDVKITYILNKKAKTVSIDNMRRMSINEDIPDELFNDGNYIEQDLVDHMILVALDYKDSLIKHMED